MLVHIYSSPFANLLSISLSLMLISFSFKSYLPQTPIGLEDPYVIVGNSLRLKSCGGRSQSVKNNLVRPISRFAFKRVNLYKFYTTMPRLKTKTLIFIQIYHLKTGLKCNAIVCKSFAYVTRLVTVDIELLHVDTMERLLLLVWTTYVLY